MPPKKIIFLKTLKISEIQNFEPPKMTRAYYMYVWKYQSTPHTSVPLLWFFLYLVESYLLNLV